MGGVIRQGILAGLWFVVGLAAQTPSLAQVPATLTEIDKLRIENANLYELLTTYVEEADTCRGQLAKPRADANRTAANERRAQLKARIEAAHPGFTFAPETGALTPTPAPERK